VGTFTNLAGRGGREGKGRRERESE